MNYSTATINANFRIKVYGWIDGLKIDMLVGVSGLLQLIGTDLANKFVERAFNSKEDRTICKLRRGLKITFYVK